MCRWFAYLSEEPVLLADVLIYPKHALVKQLDSHYLPDVHLSFQASDTNSPNPLTNVDGYGVAWYTPVANKFDLETDDKISLPALYKTIQPALHDANLRSIAANTSTKTLVAHLRAAIGTTVMAPNNHPFVFGRFTFCHNGQVQDFQDIKLPLLQLCSPTARRAILGTTDSEHMAALFFTHLDPAGPWTKEYPLEQMETALKSTMADMQRLIDADGLKSGEHSALNVCVTDGQQMLATRFSHPATHEPPSLYWSTTAGAKLNSKFKGHPDHDEPADHSANKKHPSEHGRHVIIASEPSTYKAEDWHLIEANTMVSVTKDFQLKKLSLSTPYVPQSRR